MYFDLTQKQFFVLVIFGGILLINILAIGYYSFRLNLQRKPDEEDDWGEIRDDKEEEERDYPAGLHQKSKPVPLFLILIIAAVFLWAFGYIIAIALGGIHVQ